MEKRELKVLKMKKKSMLILQVGETSFLKKTEVFNPFEQFQSVNVCVARLIS